MRRHADHLHATGGQGRGRSHGTMPGRSRHFNAAAWIEGQPDSLAAGGAQTLSLAQTRRVAMRGMVRQENVTIPGEGHAISGT